MSNSNKNELDKIKMQMSAKGERLEALISLGESIKKSSVFDPISFNDFLYTATRNPKVVFRDIYQLFYDMVHHYIKGIKGSIKTFHTAEEDFSDYDCSALFEEKCDEPFFADTMFVTRLIKMVNSFKLAAQKNQIILFDGPPGSGKSTFLNNILFKLEEYTKTPGGAFYSTLWHIDIEKLGGYSRLIEQIKSHNNGKDSETIISQFPAAIHNERYLDFACPNHDHPIIQIPKVYRRKFLNEMIPGGKFKHTLFRHKEYEWVFKDIPCSICSSIYSALANILDDTVDIYNMIMVRRSEFDRQTGVGISVYNPGDPVIKKPITNPILQQMINSLLNTDRVRYIYSPLANTNNGVMALMDIKENNIERLRDLHGIVSDGIHKVEFVEERIRTIFIGLVNPADKEHYDKIPSFRDRIATVKIPYILDYETETEIYINKFGRAITARFLPGVLENFAKLVIASRVSTLATEIRRWLKDEKIYAKHTDPDLLLLKLELYTGRIPDWITEEDVANYTDEVQKDISHAASFEGDKGVSGRQSLILFNMFMAKYSSSNRLITIDNVIEFARENSELKRQIPHSIIKPLTEQYNYSVLQQVKQAIYSYNKEEISKTIMNYLFALSFEPGTEKLSPYTNENIEITEEFFNEIENNLLGAKISNEEKIRFRDVTRKEFISKTLTIDIKINNIPISDTEQFQKLIKLYRKNLKENSLNNYINNNNFRRAVIDYDKPAFMSYDKQIRTDVNTLIRNMRKEFKYSLKGAQQIVAYVFDNRLFNQFKT
ncbi:MAG: hypothetical protein N4A72_21435 [Bacteroidales bacterium]|nr:hypothetical protein [Bacteroidales bacterium]